MANGPFAGRTLRHTLFALGRRSLGANRQLYREFPLLIRRIDARKLLSIQVHPNDSCALECDGRPGKTEMRYIPEVEPDSFLYYSFQHALTRQEFRERLSNDSLTGIASTADELRGLLRRGVRSSVLALSVAICGGEALDCRKRDRLFMPADSGTCKLRGELRVLIARVGTI